MVYLIFTGVFFLFDAKRFLGLGLEMVIFCVNKFGILIFWGLLGRIIESICELLSGGGPSLVRRKVFGVGVGPAYWAGVVVENVYVVLIHFHIQLCRVGRHRQLVPIRPFCFGVF
jgi:hypothetical protein